VSSHHFSGEYRSIYRVFPLVLHISELTNTINLWSFHLLPALLLKDLAPNPVPMIAKLAHYVDSSVTMPNLGTSTIAELATSFTEAMVTNP
jgi:hypothetical protein